MDNSVKARLSRIEQLYQDYKNIQWRLGNPGLTPGYTNTLKRESVFLKEKIAKTLKDLKHDVHPDFIFKVTVRDLTKTYVVLVNCANTEEVKLYFNALQALENHVYDILSIEQIATTKVIPNYGKE